MSSGSSIGSAQYALESFECKGILDESIALIGSRMSGYFSARKNLNIIDFRYVERNRKVVGKYCKTHKSDTLVNAKQKNCR
jgi:acid stress chaperone HdeB